ncbi:GNAT family N-acetyltransferase [Brachybacterium saurashtrense]|uniref:GNAT family N-acetyltransferase n=1 Tax=Brachybacterium saurashtrense TaxID=556288 RepID=A0A345YSB2_9MICO|nr:GNAT family N-acetyltransferase [Brachybacterium saurashtrense]AXK46814.1 GNAT family N-acetyltransferase [Brachybacterium saurashtrense]RRR22529.1 GNAT family N-acetyltransferase [Brachybacterium saurashtrense]
MPEEPVQPVQPDLATLHPPYGLVLRAGDLTLRPLAEADLPEYTTLIRRPIFEDPHSAHVFPWYRAEPETRVRESLRFQWRLRSGLGPEQWTLPFGVWADGRLIGCQDVSAERFAQRCTVTSGSWLTLDMHGRGYGRLMRQAMLVFAFDHLGAVRAESSAVLGNDRSTGVSRACGYVDNGTQLSSVPGSDELEQRFLVTPETFRRPDVPVEVEGLTAALRELLGA